MKISFNCRVNYSEACDCIDKIKELGGDGGITVGGSWYDGTKEQIDKLLIYMSENNYDLASMAINKMPREATQRRIDRLKAEGLI